MMSVAITVLLAAAAPPCHGPATERAPDPRCQESLDGRGPEEPAVKEVVGRAALAVPRMTAAAVVWPVVVTVEVVERRRLAEWARAIFTTDDGLVGVRPELHYSTSFLPTAGVRVFYRRLPGQGTAVVARARTAGPSVLYGQLALHGPEWSRLALTVTGDRRTDRLFAGIGPFSEAELSSAGRGAARFASDNFGAELTWSPPARGILIAALHGDVSRRDYRADGVRGGPSIAQLFGLTPDQCVALGQGSTCVDDALVPGFDRGLRIAHVGGGVGVNLRDDKRDGGGLRAIVDATFASGLAGDPSRHATFLAETVFAWGRNDKLLLLRGRASTIENLGDAAVPFDELVRPGGLAGMRGFPDGRFRGASGLVGTAEYRWYISTYLDAMLFTDVGIVAGPRFAGLEQSRWFPSFGMGLRFYRPSEGYWDAQAEQGVQLAYAPDGGFRVLLSLAAF